MGKLLWAGAVLAVVALIAFGSGGRAPEADAAGITLQEIAPGTSSPVSIVNAGDNSDRLFVVEQTGKVRVITNVGSGDTLLGPAFIDVGTLIPPSPGPEEGLLNIAFHPSYETNGRFFLYLTTPGGDIQIRAYTALVPSSNVANAGLGSTVITILHPGNNNHNGGALVFGPDGYLYAGIGDGGGGGDPGENAEDVDSLLGKILRLDVNTPPYVSPPSNPFVGSAGLDEIWAYGLRNPWRMSFDRLNGDLYIGDVGQDLKEEANRQLAGAAGGANYGWDIFEGTDCYEPNPTCNTAGITMPILEYAHTLPGICAITGGYRYRGAAPSLAGQYVYGDFCTGEIWGATLSGSTWTSALLLNSNTLIASFGEDEDGELYLADSINSRVYRIVPDADTDGDGDPDSADNCVSVPNQGQEQSDGNFTDLSPPKGYDDRTWPKADATGDACDIDNDRDNDGRSDSAEAAGTGCGVFTSPTSLTSRDSDGDLMLDGAECVSGLNPSAPNTAMEIDAVCPPGALGDTDGDGLTFHRERCYYNTDPAVLNTDGDICHDGREVASINADNTVSAIDLSQVAQVFGSYAGLGPPYADDKYTFDMNKDRTISAIDLSFVAQRFGTC